MSRSEIIRRAVVVALLAGGAAIVSAEAKANGKSGVQLVVKEADRRVDVLVDGQPFTSYIWPTTLKKPVL